MQFRSLGKKIRRSNSISDALSVYDHHVIKKMKYILYINTAAKNYTVYKYI